MKIIPAVFSGVEDSYQRSGILMGELRQLDDEARRFIAPEMLLSGGAGIMLSSHSLLFIL